MTHKQLTCVPKNTSTQISELHGTKRELNKNKLKIKQGDHSKQYEIP